MRSSCPGTSEGTAAPSHPAWHQHLVPPARGRGALHEGWSPGKLRSYQRGLSSTEGDSLSYSPESGSIKEAGNDYGAYGGA